MVVEGGVLEEASNMPARGEHPVHALGATAAKV
jgi:hypothetical protein